MREIKFKEVKIEEMPAKCKEKMNEVIEGLGCMVKGGYKSHMVLGKG